MKTHVFTPGRVLAIATAAFLVAAAPVAAAPFAYVPVSGENQLAVIDLATNTLVTKIATGANPSGVAVSPAGNRVYVTNADEGTVTVVDSLNNRVVSTISVGSQPLGLAVSPDGHRVAVAYLGTPPNDPNRSVAVIDVGSGAVTPLAVDAGPVAAIYNASGSRLYVSNFLSNTISIIDAPNLHTIGRISVPPNPFGLAINPSGSRLYSGHFKDPYGGLSQVSVVDTESAAVVATIALDGDPAWLALDPTGARLFVAKPSKGTITVIDTASNSVLFDFILGSFSVPTGVAVHPDGSRLYVVDNGLGELSVYDAGNFQRIGGVPVGAGAVAYGDFVGPQVVGNGADSPGPLSGLWWNSSESGWGINFTQRGSNIFAAWYTYDSAGKPKWYVAPNCAMPAQSSCSGTLYQVTGPLFFGVTFDPSQRNVTAVGSISVSFADNNFGSMSYNVAGQTRSLPIQRQIFRPGPEPQINYTDMWWNPAESGWGMAITQQSNVMFLAWYVYDDVGQPTWYVASNCDVNEAGDSCAGTVYRTTGPPFGPSFDPSQVHATAQGRIIVNFSDANNGTINYLFDSLFVTKKITRQLF